MLPIHLALLAGAFATPMNSLLSDFKPKVSSQPPSMTEPADSIMEDVEVADNTASLSVEIDNLAASCPEYALNSLKDYVMRRTEDTKKIFKNLDPQCVEAINGLCAKDIFKKQATQPIFWFYSGVQIQDIDQYESLKQLECDVGWSVGETELEEFIQTGIINPLRSVGLYVSTPKKVLKIATAFPRLAELEISLNDDNARSLEFQIDAKEVKVLRLTTWSSGVTITKSDTLLHFPNLQEVSLYGFIVKGVKFPESLKKVHANTPAIISDLSKSELKELSFEIDSKSMADTALRSLPRSLEKLVISGGNIYHDTVKADLSYLKSLVVLETSLPIEKVPDTLKSFAIADNVIDQRSFQRFIPTLVSSGATELAIKTSSVHHDLLANLIPLNIEKLRLLKPGYYESGASIQFGYASMKANHFTHVFADLADRDSLCSLAEIVKNSKNLESLEFTIGLKKSSNSACERIAAKSIPENLKNLKIGLPENLHEIMLTENFAFAQSIQNIVFKVMELDGVNDHGFLQRVAPYLILMKRPEALNEKVKKLLSETREVVVESGMTKEDLDAIPANLRKLTIIMESHQSPQRKGDLAALGSLVKASQSLQVLELSGKPNSEIADQLSKQVWNHLSHSLKDLSVGIQDSGLKVKHLEVLKRLRKLKFITIEPNSKNTFPKSLQHVIIGHSYDHPNNIQEIATHLVQLEHLQSIHLEDMRLTEADQWANILKSRVKLIIYDEISMFNGDQGKYVKTEAQGECLVEQIILEKNYPDLQDQGELHDNLLKAFFKRTFGNCKTLKKVTIVGVDSHLKSLLTDALPEAKVVIV